MLLQFIEPEQESTLRVIDVWRRLHKHAPAEMTYQMVNIGAGDRCEALS